MYVFTSEVALIRFMSLVTFLLFLQVIYGMMFKSRMMDFKMYHLNVAIPKGGATAKIVSARNMPVE